VPRASFSPKLILFRWRRSKSRRRLNPQWRAPAKRRISRVHRLKLSSTWQVLSDREQLYVSSSELFFPRKHLLSLVFSVLPTQPIVTDRAVSKCSSARKSGKVRFLVANEFSGFDPC
jgi:hypothetical protein